MNEYYHISQLTGIGYEALLDSVDGTVLATFYQGTMVCVGDNPVMDDIIAMEGEATLTQWEAA